MYYPHPIILERYARVLINFALHWWQGVKPGDVVLLAVPECARSLLDYLYRAVIDAGAHPVVRLIPDGLSAYLFEQGSDDQLTWTARHSLLGEVEDIDHRVAIIADHDKYELAHIDPKKIMLRQKSMKYYKDALFAKEDQGKLTRTLALYGTSSMAANVGMSLQEYRNQIINACFLDHEDPIAHWRQTFSFLEHTKSRLNALSIERLHVQWEDVDLRIKIWANRQRLGWSGRNIPSFELFISPDRRGTNWWMRFNQPLWRNGSVIKGIVLRFDNGVVVEATAQEGEQLLKEMIAVENANKIGEYSLTDRRTSRIDRIMGETLYDENIGGLFGNTHLAIWSAYKESYRGDVASVSKDQRDERWFNDSVIHTDIVSTTNRVVTATLTDGSCVVIYRDGQFCDTF